MSECKHVMFYINKSVVDDNGCTETGFGTGLIKCYDCGKTLNDILIDLRAKLEATERKLYDEQEEHAKLQARCYEGFSSISDGIFTAFEQAEKERDDLQRQVTRLEETDRHREFCMVEMAQKIAEYEHQEGVDLAFVLDRYKEHRDYVAGLEATIAQMRGAVQKEIDRLKNVYEADGYPTVTVVAVKDNLERLLSTPPTAYQQKVQELVDALEWYANEDHHIRHTIDLTVETEIEKDLGEIASKALAAFSGGEK